MTLKRIIAELPFITTMKGNDTHGNSTEFSPSWPFNIGVINKVERSRNGSSICKSDHEYG